MASYIEINFYANFVIKMPFLYTKITTLLGNQLIKHFRFIPSEMWQAIGSAEFLLSIVLYEWHQSSCCNLESCTGQWKGAFEI